MPADCLIAWKVMEKLATSPQPNGQKGKYACRRGKPFECAHDGSKLIFPYATQR